MRAPLLCFILLVVYSVSRQSQTAYSVASVWAEDGAAECCGAQGPEIKQLFKNADRFYAQFKPKESAVELQKILQVDPANSEAMLKLCRAHIDMGDMVPDSGQDWKEKKLKEYKIAEDYAHKAVRIKPDSSWAYFYVAASIGSAAFLAPVSKQIEMAGEIREAVEKSISLDPQNGYAYHVYGVWQRKMAEIGKTSRMFASLVYGRSPPTGSLEKSIEYLKKAVALNPKVITSRLELAKSYLALENWQMARNFLLSIKDLPVQFSDDAKHKHQAEELIAQINDR